MNSAVLDAYEQVCQAHRDGEWTLEEWVAEVYLPGDGDTRPGWYALHAGLKTKAAAMSWAAEARRHGDVSRERNVHG